MVVTMRPSVDYAKKETNLSDRNIKKREKKERKEKKTRVSPREAFPRV